jgi:hypothetical protein
MTFKIFVTPLASIDIEDIVAYLAISNSDVAMDFFDAVRITFESSMVIWLFREQGNTQNLQLAIEALHVAVPQVGNWLIFSRSSTSANSSGDISSRSNTIWRRDLPVAKDSLATAAAFR